MVPYLNSTNAGGVEDAEPAAASGNAQDYSGVDQGPVRAADIEYPAEITRSSKSPSTSMRCAPSRQASSSHSAQAMQKGGRAPPRTLPSRSNMQQPSQSNSLQQQSFNFEDPDEKLSKEQSAILTEFKRLQTCIHGMEQQMAQIVDDCGALRSRLDLQMRRGQEMEKKNIDLQLKIDELEALHGQRALAESGPYQSSAATPRLLQDAADEVKDAIAAFALEFFSTFKLDTSIDFDAVQEGVAVDSRSNETVRAALQGMISKVFFKDFRDPYFSLREKPGPSLQTPLEQKSALLQDFRRCRDNPDPKQLLLEDSDLGLFFITKVAAMKEEIKTLLLRPTKVQFAVESFGNGILDPENESSIYRGKFARVARTVWVLHKVAMSFEPHARILPVCSGMSLNTIYMEDIATHDEEAEEDETAALQKQVMFVCVPGFSVRPTVIRSRVFCLKRL